MMEKGAKVRVESSLRFFFDSEKNPFIGLLGAF